MRWLRYALIALVAAVTTAQAADSTQAAADTSHANDGSVAGSISGLNFPSNGQSPSDAFVAFQFLNPQNKGLPIWGAGNAGATYIWKILPRQQTGYYVTFWWSNNGEFWWDAGSPNTYYGAHPYPQSRDLNGTTHWWEIATDRGGDYFLTRKGTEKTVVKDRWYTQALRVQVNSDGTKTLLFYIDLPSTAAGNVISVPLPESFGAINPPAPALTFGDSPWSKGHERLSGVLRGIKIFNHVLSRDDMLAEAASDALVTNAGKANVWYMNINPRPNDITDKSGKGHHPAWADPAHKATLWTQ